MALSVFKEASNGIAGTFSSNRAGMAVGGAGGHGGKKLGLVTNVNIQFSQNVSRIFDLNRANAVQAGAGDAEGADKNPMYYVGGRAQGTLTLGRILGPAGSPCEFYKTFGDVCNIYGSVVLTFTGGKGAAGAVAGQPVKCATDKIEFTCISPIITNIGITQNANDTMINENVTMMIADLQCGEAQGAGAAGGILV